MAAAEAEDAGPQRPAPSEAPEADAAAAAAAALALKPRERSSPRPAAEDATQSAKAPVSDGKRRPEATLIGPGMDSAQAAERRAAAADYGRSRRKD